MKVLFIDDDLTALESFTEYFRFKYGQGYEITSVDNLVDFDERLYHNMERLEYDKIIMDLRIDPSPDFNEDAYNTWLADLGITERTKINNNTEIIGWDYFVKVIRKQQLTSNHLDRFMIKSGYGDLIKSKVDISLLGEATLLEKGSKQYDEIINNFLKR